MSENVSSSVKESQLSSKTEDNGDMDLMKKQSREKVLDNDEVSKTDIKSGTKVVNVKTQETTEKTNFSPSRSNQPGIGVTKCPICGKQFGKSSLRFHQPQCERKQAMLQEKHEQEKLEQKRTSSYIIYEDFNTGKYEFLAYCFCFIRLKMQYIPLQFFLLLSFYVLL